MEEVLNYFISNLPAFVSILVSIMTGIMVIAKTVNKIKVIADDVINSNKNLAKQNAELKAKNSELKRENRALKRKFYHLGVEKDDKQIH